MRLLVLVLFAASLTFEAAPTFGQEAPAQEAPAPAPDARTNPAKCTVAGTVLRKGSDEPIHFARVTLTSTADEGNKLHAVTGVDGKFAIKDVPPGEYQLTAVRNGYVDESYGARHLLDPGVPFTVSAAKPPDNLLFRLTPASVITGHVRDENGEPLVGAHVTALVTRFSDGKRALVPVGQAPVNDLGEYRIFGLPPGKYLLSAGFNGFNSRAFVMGSGFVDAQGNYEEREGLVTTYYPGTTDPSQAAAVNVDAGAEARSVDFSIQPTGTFHVRGHLLGIPKDATFSGTVLLRSANGRLATVLPEKQGTIGDKDGSFDIGEVASGSYEIVAVQLTGENPRMAHRPVEVNGADVDGIDLTFQPTATIQGHLRWEDKPAVAEEPIQVMLELEETVLGGEPLMAPVQPDGSFELKYVATDAYGVNISGTTPDAYLKSAYYGSTNAINEFHPAAGSDATLELVVSARGAHIQGTVMNSDSLPVAGVWVALIPEEASGKLRRLFQSTRTGANGKFEFRGLAPGTYSLYSWDNVEEHEWDDPEFLKPFKTKSASVTVAEGENKSLDLTLIQTQSEAEARQ